MFGLELSYKTFNNNNATPPQAQKKGSQSLRHVLLSGLL